ncbi:hypothetical protein K438DRAFT_1579731 [Mycena galopus ATCC 62051]|nr:hypothetical protein K438DRAFT_1579731 [Mycena galopus ATCC 62051]
MPPVYTNHNPYDGWSRANSGSGQNWSQYGASSSSSRGGDGSSGLGLAVGEAPPSVFGALPYPTPPSSYMPNLTTFFFTALSPSVLNCAVVGPPGRSRLHYTISTDSNMAGYTVVKNAERKSIALIEWTNHPRVEIRGVIPKQEIKGWLKISRDQTYRTMTVRGFEYTWAPDNQYINLCSSGPSSQFLGRISRAKDGIFVELTPDAIQLGLQDTTIVVAVLLQCGHNID